MTVSDTGIIDTHYTTDSSVAVYITTKNRRAMLDRALNSVLRQTIKPDEIIIVDDGSTDETARYLETVSEAYASITVITNKTSMGACKARNIAISRAKSRYITGLDDDDEFTRNRLKEFIDAADQLQNGFSALTSHMIQIRPRVRIRRRLKHYISLRDMLFKNHAGNQVFTETSRLRAINGFDEKLPAMQDYDTWLRLIAAYGPILTVSSFSYILHLEHLGPRVTSNKNRIEAEAIFYSKHNNLMETGHHCARNLYLAINEKRKIDFAFVRQNITAETGTALLKYYVLSNSPLLQKMKQTIFG